MSIKNSIDPRTADPTTPFWVRIPGIDYDVIGQRVVDPDDPDDAWYVLAPWGEGKGRYPDHEVTVLRPVDAPLPDWETIRRTMDILARDGRTSNVHWLGIVADRLEAEHKAAQEKAERDAKLDDAILVFKTAWHVADAGGRKGSRVRAGLEALIEAGLFEAVAE